VASTTRSSIPAPPGRIVLYAMSSCKVRGALPKAAPIETWLEIQSKGGCFTEVGCQDNLGPSRLRNTSDNLGTGTSLRYRSHQTTPKLDPLVGSPGVGDFFPLPLPPPSGARDDNFASGGLGYPVVGSVATQGARSFEEGKNPRK
jgi:hypothetical protein